MSKQKCVIYAPISSYSGYGAKSRDTVKALIELYENEWDFQIIPCSWGSLPLTFIDDNPQWKWLEKYTLNTQLTYQPDIMIWITIPSETQPIGKRNILFTAGVETTLCPPEWIDFINKMDLTIVPSEHSKKTLLSSIFEKREKDNNQLVGELKINKPIVVVPEGFNEDIYKHISKLEPNDNIKLLDNIEENFCYLFTGMWLQGTFNEDRKNVGGLIKIFLESFKNKKNPPALILKTSTSSPSIIDQNKIKDRIDKIKRSIDSKILPNIYLLYGDVTDEEMNMIYNHPKIKTMVSLTKGEGFGRPLLEFTQSKKPVICSEWGGQADFLHKEKSLLIPGTLTPVHESALMKNIIIKDSKWFTVNYEYTKNILQDFFNNYKNYKGLGPQIAYYCLQNFSYNKMKDILKNSIDNNIEMPYQLKMPKLTKIK